MSDSGIDGKPQKAVTNLSLTREGNVFTVSWKSPHALIDSSGSKRVEAFDVYWYVANPQCEYYRSGNANTFPATGSRSSSFIAAPDYQLVMHEWLSTSATSDSYTVNLDPRQFLRGNTAKNILAKASSMSINSADKTDINNGSNPVNQSSATGIVAAVYPWNHYGYGPKAVVRFMLYQPSAPKMTTPSLNTETGSLSTTVTMTTSDTNAYPVYCSTGYVARIDNFNSNYKSETKLTSYSWSASAERTFSYDLAEWQSLTYDQYIKLTFYANVYGIGRATKALAVNEKCNTRSDYVSKYASVSHIFAYPAQASITSIDYSNANLVPTGQVIVHLNTNKTTYHPVDSIKLMILKNSTATTANDAGRADGWTYVSNAEDNGNCVGLVDTMANAIPDVGKHTWYKLETKHDTFLRYSVAVEAKGLYRSQPEQSSDPVVIASVVPNSDGTSVTMTLGWNADSYTGTEISWAEKETAWESTSQPASYNVTWSKNSTTVVQGKNRYAKVSIEGLSEGTPYYFKARRYLTNDSGTTYAEYTSYKVDGKLATVAPVSKPYSVTVSTPEYLVKGKSLLVSWAYEANQRQTGWRIYFVRETNGDTVTKLMASGSNSTTYKVISGATVKDYAGDDSDIYVRVSVSTGGDWANSLNAKTHIVTAPGLTLSAPNGLNSAPYVFAVYTSQHEADVVCKIKSYGNVRNMPDKTIVETDGETVWSKTVSFEGFTDATALSNGQSVSVEVGEDFSFVDGSRYRIEAQAVNRTTGLTSAAKTVPFKVRWNHQAIAPSKTASYVTADNYNGGNSVTIFPGRPYGDSIAAVNAYGDLCDIYRVTPETTYLVAYGVKFDEAVVDKYAPYNKNGNLRYILCTRTTEGDVNWIEVPYFLRNMNLRFDWGDGEFLEVPYNLDISDQYDKSFTGHESLDGGYSGAWNDTVRHKQKVSTDIIKLDNAIQIEQVRKMAKYSGPIFVRTPDGQAFAANVTVDDIQRNQEKPVMAVSFNCEEIDLVDEFKIQ